MKELRLMVVAGLMAALLMGERPEKEEGGTYDSVDVEFVPDIPPSEIPPIPECQFFSFLDQTTGTWRKDMK